MVAQPLQHDAADGCGHRLSQLVPVFARSLLDKAGRITSSQHCSGWAVHSDMRLVVRHGHEMCLRTVNDALRGALSTPCLGGERDSTCVDPSCTGYNPAVPVPVESDEVVQVVVRSVLLSRAPRRAAHQLAANLLMRTRAQALMAAR